jgi:DNA-binding MarR family transcriptional regulator
MGGAGVSSSNSVQNTHISDLLRRLHLAMVEIVSAMNRAHNDEALMQEAGVRLDRALLPLLVGVDKLGPISVGDLADRSGRDYTTVSRQLKKLKELGLVERSSSAADQRISVAEVTELGQRTAGALDQARERLARAALSDWNVADLDLLVSLLERLTAAMRDEPSAPPPARTRPSP